MVNGFQMKLTVVSSGEVLGLLGPNGAGKSTVMHMLSGDTEPTAGQVSSPVGSVSTASFCSGPQKPGGDSESSRWFFIY